MVRLRTERPSNLAVQPDSPSLTDPDTANTSSSPSAPRFLHARRNHRGVPWIVFRRKLNKWMTRTGLRQGLEDGWVFQLQVSHVRRARRSHGQRSGPDLHVAHFHGTRPSKSTAKEGGAENLDEGWRHVRRSGANERKASGLVCSWHDITIEWVNIVSMSTLLS